MLRMLLLPCLVALNLFAASAAESKSLVRPLKVHAVTGEHAGKELNYAAERKAGTTVVLFVNAEQWSRPVARYLKVLDSELAKGVPGAEKAEAVAVWLTEDASQSKDYLPKAQMSLSLTKTSLTVFEGPKAGPEGWNVDIAAQLTAVVLRDGQEVARFDYRSTNDQDVPDLLKALGKQQ
jgi:hypothetical protein